jgi:hypothetical protein
MPYYKYSTDNPFFSTVHVEHHFNGLLTNKIPGFRKLNWFLVGGSNALYVNSQNKYVEAFVGLENIFKIIRLDFVMNFEPGLIQRTGFKLAIGSWSRDDND